MVMISTDGFGVGSLELLGGGAMMSMEGDGVGLEVLEDTLDDLGLNNLPDLDLLLVLLSS